MRTVQLKSSFDRVAEQRVSIAKEVLSVFEEGTPRKNILRKLCFSLKSLSGCFLQNSPRSALHHLNELRRRQDGSVKLIGRYDMRVGQYAREVLNETPVTRLDRVRINHRTEPSFGWKRKFRRGRVLNFSHLGSCWSVKNAHKAPKALTKSRHESRANMDAKTPPPCNENAKTSSITKQKTY